MIDHFVELFQTSLSLRSCQKLHQYCADAIVNNPEIFFNASDFVQLEHDTLKVLLDQDVLTIPEIEIWNKVVAWGTANTAGLTVELVSWTKSDFQMLGNTLKDVLPLIRYVSINRTDFHDHVLTPSTKRKSLCMRSLSGACQDCLAARPK